MSFVSLFQARKAVKTELKQTLDDFEVALNDFRAKCLENQEALNNAGTDGRIAKLNPDDINDTIQQMSRLKIVDKGPAPAKKELKKRTVPRPKAAAKPRKKKAESDSEEEIDDDEPPKKSAVSSRARRPLSEIQNQGDDSDGDNVARKR